MKKIIQFFLYCLLFLIAIFFYKKYFDDNKSTDISYNNEEEQMISENQNIIALIFDTNINDANQRKSLTARRNARSV